MGIQWDRFFKVQLSNQVVNKWRCAITKISLTDSIIPQFESHLKQKAKVRGYLFAVSSFQVYTTGVNVCIHPLYTNVYKRTLFYESLVCNEPAERYTRRGLPFLLHAYQCYRNLGAVVVQLIKPNGGDQLVNFLGSPSLHDWIYVT